MFGVIAMSRIKEPGAVVDGTVNLVIRSVPASTRPPVGRLTLWMDWLVPTREALLGTDILTDRARGGLHLDSLSSGERTGISP